MIATNQARRGRKTAVSVLTGFADLTNCLLGETAVCRGRLGLVDGPNRLPFHLVCASGLVWVAD